MSNDKDKDTGGFDAENDMEREPVEHCTPQNVVQTRKLQRTLKYLFQKSFILTEEVDR